ncbi:hypothetical protein JW707_01555 [Candidatus Woesearchaeota archaeon]|nr:hypothetical protein [Candidatus Woesearchaeota archaeon]
MDPSEFMRSCIELRAALANAKANKIEVDKPPARSKIYDFSNSKETYYRNAVATSFNQVKTKANSLLKLVDEDPANGAIIDKIRKMVADLDFADSKDKVLAKIIELVSQIQVSKVKKLQKPSYIPSEIRDDVNADIDELNKAFNAGCYRSAAILCGRILETALHRKYFEATGDDLLEKAPGIGLGKIVAKLSEKNISFDPGLMQQIHLINNVRVSSVHVKQEPFNPSKAQTEAMILYTIDILEKIFSSKSQ